MRPPKENPRARSKRHAGPSFVYARNLESFGGSVLQKAAIVVSSKPLCKNQGMSCHAKTKGTYYDVCVFDTPSQRLYYSLPNFRILVDLFPLRIDVHPSEDHKTGDAVDVPCRSLSERLGAVRRDSLVKDPSRWPRGGSTVLLHGGCGHGSTKHSSETSLVGEHRGPMIDPSCTREVLYTCVTIDPERATLYTTGVGRTYTRHVHGERIASATRTGVCGYEPALSSRQRLERLTEGQIAQPSLSD